MKPKHIILIVAMALTATFGILALAQQSKSNTPQFMETRWKKVEEFANKEMPESALKEVEAILAQAKKENNTPQILRAMVYKMRFATDKNPDEIVPQIREFEASAEIFKKPADKAVALMMTAELYHKYYLQNRYNIDRRTEMQGATPDDVKEWTKNHFADKIVKLSALAFASPADLQKTDVQNYGAILERGKDSRTIQPTLFDFLSYKKNELLTSFAGREGEIYSDFPIQAIQTSRQATLNDELSNALLDDPKLIIRTTYDQLIDFNTREKNVPAVVYAELQKLQFENPAKDDEYLKKLDTLEKRFTGNEAVVEVLSEKASYYLNKDDGTPQKTGEKYRKTAYEIAQSGIKQFPNYPRIGLLKNIQKALLTKSIETSNSSVSKPNTELKIKVKSVNVKELKLTVYRVHATALEYQKYKLNENRRYEKSLYPKRAQVFTQTLSTKPTDNFDAVDTVFTIQTGGYGIYEFTVEEPANKKAEEKTLGGFTVTDLAFFQRATEPNATNSNTKISNVSNGELYVVDRVSGKPLKDVMVSLYNQKWTGKSYNLNFIETVTVSTGNKYLISTERNNHTIACFERGNDRYFTSDTQFYWYPNPTRESKEVSLSLFTDRSMYRPGQTVYYKGIAYYSTKSEQKVAENKEFTVELFNANGENIGKQKLKTNEFGSFAGSFILSEKGLNGAYRLSANSASTTIYVEEYKRPTFEVTMERPKDEVRFGEAVTVKGNVKAYAGYNVNDADVKYRVVRRPHRFWWWFSEPDKIITTGTAKTDSNGNFEVKFTPEKDKNAVNISAWRGKPSNDTYYTYHVYADVTDPKGETQQGEQSLSVGDKSLFILAVVPDKVDRNEKFSLDVTTQTLNGETVPSTVDYKIVKLENSEIYLEKVVFDTPWKEAGVVLSGSLDTKDKLELDLKKIPSGMYKIVFATKDNRGNEVTSEHRFVLYDKNDKRPPVKAYTWLTKSNTELNAGEKATINFGTSTKNAFVLYEIMQGQKALESRWIEMSDEIKTFEIPFKAEYGAGVTAQFTFVKDEQFFTEQVTISRKVEEKKLMPSVSVFRDKLKPGENAEWTIHIPEAGKDKKTAELLIGMYDASLDALRPHSWSFNPTYREWARNTTPWYARGIGEIDQDMANFSENDWVNVAPFVFDDFDWFDLDLGGYSNVIRMRGGGGVRKAMAVQEEVAFSSDALVLNEVALDYAPPSAKQSAQPDVAPAVKEKPQPPVRTNFNETAFFYPQLRTDADGNVKVAFTAPESLTRWNVKMLAHTKDLYFGQNEMQAITQKELMVQMNLPRFVRKSDVLTLSANITNLSEIELKPIIKLEIDNQAPQPPKGGVSVQPKETVAFEWKLDNFKDKDLAVVKIVAEAGNFSDVEQRYLPVLPDKVLVTESQTMTLRAGQKRTFTFENFIQNLKNVDTENFTVEYAGNPTWYAIQALPSVAKSDGENAIDYLSGYYANTLGSYIATSNPKLAETFDRWKKAGGTRDALLSNLEKNQELKNMLLEETPWVLSAKDETEQKRQIALLFDLNQTRNQAQTYMDKLLKLQSPNGGFAWFEGMPENRYITQEILLNLARLNKMTKGDLLTVYRLPLTSALKYLDLQIAKDFSELKKWNKNYRTTRTIGNTQLFYLHVRSEYPQIPIEKSAVEAVEYYTAQSEKYWTNWSLYGKAMMATVAHRNGKTKVADEILVSLRENAMKTDELGMYWAKNTAGWWWYERPIATQTAIMEAFNEVRKAGGDIDEMKIWLLKQKQTQRWDTPISTLDAIYALLNYGTDWLSNQGDVVIKLGATTLKPKEVEAGTAYIKETIPVETLKPEMGKITVESKSTSGISWGSAYWQYYQDVDKVQSQGKEMKISKQLFVERVTNQGKSMLPITQTALKKGDKVITRLVVTTDRDLEFVLLKDLRASCFEPVTQISGTRWKEGTVYYQTTKDASTQFFFNYLPKGTYVFEYELWANNAGTFSSGMASV
ncbi:MAG: hypothetical protein GX102_08620, partial [Porphyromonadaceae bacterium]|nr:hypothetical protein [Porphyromonadaceae bacterium]